MSYRNRMAKGFTLVEILIVVVILGILAAIVIPQFTRASEAANASSLASQLQTLRSQLELYQVQHSGAYPDLITDWSQMTGRTAQDGTAVATGGFGPYLQAEMRNPFGNSTTVAADTSGGWQYELDGTGNPTGRVRAVVTTTAADNDVLTNAGLLVPGVSPGVAAADWGDIVRP